MEIKGNQRKDITTLSRALNQLLRDRATELGMDNRALARHAGMSPATLTRIFKHGRVLDVNEFQRLCVVLGLSPWKIMQAAEEPVAFHMGNSRVVESLEEADELARNLAVQFRNEAERQGINQVAMAEATGISQGKISKIYSLQQMASLPQILRITQVLGLSLAEAIEAVENDRPLRRKDDREDEGLEQKSIEIVQWYTKATGGDSENAVALKAGISQTTLNRQLRAGRLTPEVVVAISRAYRAPVSQALVIQGLLTKQDTGADFARYARELALTEFSDAELAAEIVRRLKSAPGNRTVRD